MSVIRDHFLDRRLASIDRWGTAHTICPKCVAQHSYYVARIARRICHLLEAEAVKVKGRPVKADVLKVLDMALMHDEEEAITGDIVHTVKNSTPELNQAISNFAERQLVDEYSWLPRGDYFVEIWRQCKDDGDSLEAQIVSVADKIAGFAEAKEEMDLGNQLFRDFYANYKVLLGRADYPWFKRIRDQLSLRGV